MSLMAVHLKKNHKKTRLYLIYKHRLLASCDNDIIAVSAQKWRVGEEYKNHGVPQSRGLMWHIMETEGATHRVHSIKHNDAVIETLVSMFKSLQG